MESKQIRNVKHIFLLQKYLCKVRQRDVSSLQQLMHILRLNVIPVFHWKSWGTTTCFKVGSWELGRAGEIDTFPSLLVTSLGRHH